jgi:hypothetical protein
VPFPNRYPGNCRNCGARVAPQAGLCERVDGAWIVRHIEGQCGSASPADIAAATLPPVIEVTTTIAPPAVDSSSVIVNGTTFTYQGIQEISPPANVGELAGIMRLFDVARSHLRHPTICLNIPNWTLNNGIRISVAGQSSRYPGSLFVTYDRPGAGRNRPYLGRVTLEGNFIARGMGAGQQEALTARLREFAADPARVAGEAGRLAGKCCFCRLPLTDERSTAVGYGMICAGHYGLPWGSRPAEFAAPVAETGGVVARQRAIIRPAMREPLFGLPYVEVTPPATPVHRAPARTRARHKCPACECEAGELRDNGTSLVRFHCLECSHEWQGGD